MLKSKKFVTEIQLCEWVNGLNGPLSADIISIVKDVTTGHYVLFYVE
jgi:hypothetical protein